MLEIKLIAKLVLLLLLIVGVFLWSDIYLPVHPGTNKVVEFTVQKGQGAKEISISLKNEGLIKHTSTFRIYALLSGKSHKLQAGQYELSLSMSSSQMVDKMARGDVKREIVTIIEGWDLRDIAEYFEEQGISTKEQFLDLAKKDFTDGLTILQDKPKTVTIEGYVFPDTYEVAPGTGAEDIIKKILSNFDEKLRPELRAEIEKQKRSIFDIITAASLIEKEVKSQEDKKVVSGILLKRLAISMPLQIDATITYITGRAAVSFSDLEIDSPYNTYKYYGLPLGPISNPGLESIEAAIYPTMSDYLYYFTARSGKTIFSKTYAEHQRQLDKYR